jgi:prepilin-type processing-associated H-X9-DG protein
MLAALMMPAIQAARAAAQRTMCKNELRQLGLALHMYHENYGCFPPGSTVMGPSFPMQTGWGWGARVLPYVEQDPLYEQIDFGIGTAVGPNLSLIAASLPIWRCPSDIGPPAIRCIPFGGSPYELGSGNFCGSEGILSTMSNISMRDILDGSSNTFMLGERMVQSGESGSLPFTSAWCGQVAFATEYDYRSVPHLQASQIHPINFSPTDPSCFGSRHAGGAHFVMADGSARLVNESIDLPLYEALGTASGGEAVERP